MAIANSDGSIILSTKVDTSGINKGMSQMQSKATSLTKTFSKLGAAVASAFAIQKIIQFSNSSGQLATQTEASVQRLVDIYGSASDSVGDFIDANARALGMSKAAAASFSSVYGNLFSVWADQATNAELTNRYLNMTAVVASKTGRTVEDVQERVRSGLLGNTEAIEDLGIFVNVKTIEMTDAFQRMANGKSWEQLDAYTQQQIRSMAILEQATAKYGDEVADTSATIRNRYKAAYEDFQNSWGNIVNTVLLPVLQVLTQIFDIATRGLNALSGRSGKILEATDITEENSDKTADNINKQTDAQKDLNKELKKATASFDDVEILSLNTANDLEDSDKNNLDNIIIRSGEDFGGMAPDGSSHVEEIDETLTAIMGIVALSLAAVGLILLFTGHIGWGIGFIIAGAAVFGVTAATLGDDTIAQETKDALSNALIITGMVAILLGVLLCAASQWGIGIGLILVGAASIVTPVALNWDGIKKQLQTSFGGWLVLGGIVAIVLGILLCFTPAIGLGIGLIVLGAAAVVAPIVANWDAIWEAITGAFNAVMDWVKTYGLLVLGILLCLTGAGIPLGIALLIKWAKDGAEKGEPISTAIVDKVKEIWGSVKAFWDANIAPIFTAQWWLDLGKKCINGLIAGFEGGINGIISAFESMINWIVNGLNKLSFDIPDWIPEIGGSKWGINIPNVNFGRVNIPRLAKGAVIPGNKEFLAVLGDQPAGQTNIEAPLETIVQAFNMALNARGNDTVKEEHYYVGEDEVMSLIYRLVKRGERIEGKSLLEGW
jgi:hypothetical protein